MATCPLCATNLRKTYFRQERHSAGNFDAVADVSVEVAAGELVALTGRSGSGKSTLLSMLAGLLEPTSGSVWLCGSDLYGLSDAERSRLRNERMGIVPQGHSPIPSLTVLQNVTLPARMHASGDAVATRARSLLDRLGIGELASCRPSELSGGELRRMAIARALLGAPAVLLADEPTGDLDDENTKVVLDVLREAATGGAAVLMATHEALAASRADRTLRLDAGRLV